MPRRKMAKEEEEVYHVEVITKARVSEEGEWEYFVKWAGYDSDADSWEPTENVKQCDRLLASFWKHVGTDDEDYHIGYEIAARENWINKEKRYFQETFVKPSKRKSDKTTKDKQERQKLRGSPSPISESTVDESDCSDAEPPAQAPTAKRRARVVETDSESGSESDSHSRKQGKITSRPTAITAPSKEISKAPTQVKRQELLSAIGGSTSTAPPKTAVRTHQDQKTHPLVKSMDLPSASVGAGSSLSTKQRVAAGVPPPPTGPKPLQIVPKKSLSTLSFKKNKPAPLLIQTKDTVVPSTSVAPPTSPAVQTTKITDDADMVTSPELMDIDLPADIWGSISDDPGPPGGSPVIPTTSIPSKSQAEVDAENFLQTISVSVLSAPQEAAAMPSQLAQPTAIESPKAPVIPKIPKKWKWTGALFISTSEGTTEQLCAVTIADPSGTSNTSHANLLLSSLDSLCILRLYPIRDISSILQACGKSQYFGTLESSEEMTTHGFEHHLVNKELAAIVPLLLDATEVAVLIIFSGAQQKLTEVLQVPEDLAKEAHLLVVLLPFLVPAITLAKVAGQRSIETVMQSLSNQLDMLVPHESSQETMLYQAMTLLQFPQSLLDFLNSSSPRSYCIWPSNDHMLPRLDTIMLQHVLKSTKAVPARLEEDVRVVFICNQHLETLHTMPSLATKLANNPEVQFWTYGYTTSMASQRWKVQEIYPLGGVLTFTPSALAEDLMGCYHLMTQVIEHPLWDCYFIPEVLAVSHLLCTNKGLGSSSESCLGPILDSISLGLISVIRMPEKDHSNQVVWLSQVFNHSNASGSELLEAYLQVLQSHPKSTEQLVTITNNEISKDLSRARIQPALMEAYRRFVVIKGISEDTPPKRDGLEWSTLTTFSFRDDYFHS